MFSGEKPIDLLKLAVLILLNICIIAVAFQQTSNSADSSSEIQETASQYGSKNEEVKKIQTRLKNWGYFDGPVTGYYGDQTTAAIKKFQKKHGLKETGQADDKTLSLIGISSSTNGVTSNSDFELLARIISAESRGEPYIGQVAVGAVVLNRVESPSFPDSISEVIYQPGAFTAVNDGQIDKPVAESSRRAAREALNGSDPTGGALFYYNPDKTSDKWIRTRTVITSIGSHLFCS